MSRAPLVIAAVLVALGVAVVLVGLVLAANSPRYVRCYTSPKVVTQAGDK